jgi:putative ABC transport system substrate-binding protein
LSSQQKLQNRGTQIRRLARAVIDAAPIYYDPRFVKDGGLISDGPNIQYFYGRAAPYVDRILRGEKPADLPVQLAVKFCASAYSG